MNNITKLFSTFSPTTQDDKGQPTMTAPVTPAAPAATADTSTTVPKPDTEVQPPVTTSEVKTNGHAATASDEKQEIKGAVEAGPDAGGRLAGFLQSQKDSFLADLKAGKGKGWIVAMGNEAGDLDSLASSIAYAQLSSSLCANRVVPLALTPATLMTLRPENLLAFKNAQVPLSSLLHSEALPIPTSDLASLGVRFALVDHNRLLPQFGAGEVEGVIDHHDDEKQHLDAEVRFVQVPTGSCSSLVTKHFMPQWKASLASPAGDAASPIPNELATLLLSAGLIDTHGLKSEARGGKATATDFEAAAFLFPLTTWSGPSATSADDVTPTSLATAVPAVIKEQAGLLAEAKFNVSYLSTHDLLLRDYKEYDLPTSSSAYPVLRVGLSTVPLGLNDWLKKEDADGAWKAYLAATDAFLVERNIDIEGVLTSFKNSRGKSRRELLLVVRIGGALDDKAAKGVMKALEKGLELDPELQLEPWVKKGWKRFLNRKKRQGLDGKVRYGRVWKQGNAAATRKRVAPIVRDLVAKLA